MSGAVAVEWCSNVAFQSVEGVVIQYALGRRPGKMSSERTSNAPKERCMLSPTLLVVESLSRRNVVGLVRVVIYKRCHSKKESAGHAPWILEAPPCCKWVPLGTTWKAGPISVSSGTTYTWNSHGPVRASTHDGLSLVNGAIDSHPPRQPLSSMFFPALVLISSPLFLTLPGLKMRINTLLSHTRAALPKTSVAA
jgi:hypothetical protein